MKIPLYRKIKSQMNQGNQILSKIMLVAILLQWRMLYQAMLNPTMGKVLQ
jgi:hypothetical protein